MDEQRSILLAVAARVLSYPDESFLHEQAAVIDSIQHSSLSEEAAAALAEAINPLYALPLKDLKEVYVAVFDLKKNAGLYLTSHELGDSPKRGAALIKLQKIINEAGFERIEGELTDFMPMLYEFLAVAPVDHHHERLQKRLAFATQRILDHLSEDEPYRGIFSVLMQFVFQRPSAEEVDKLEQEREEADLEELPYPIMYQ